MEFDTACTSQPTAPPDYGFGWAPEALADGAWARGASGEETLREILAAAGDRAELLTPSGYRFLRRSKRELPPQDAIWEMFGGFQRLRERALLVAG